MLKDDKRVMALTRAVVEEVFRDGPVETWHRVYSIPQSEMADHNRHCMNRLYSILLPLLSEDREARGYFMEHFRCHLGDWDEPVANPVLWCPPEKMTPELLEQKARSEEPSEPYRPEGIQDWPAVWPDGWNPDTGYGPE